MLLPISCRQFARGLVLFAIPVFLDQAELLGSIYANTDQKAEGEEPRGDGIAPVFGAEGDLHLTSCVFACYSLAIMINMKNFWNKVNKSGTLSPFRPDLGPCWIWNAAKMPTGYGYFAIGGNRSTYAHRIAYESLRGPIPSGLTIDHLCRMRACVNPEHLEVVTREENGRRTATVTPRPIRTHCRLGHPLQGKNIYITNGATCCRACHNAAALRHYHQSKIRKN